MRERLHNISKLAFYFKFGALYLNMVLTTKNGTYFFISKDFDGNEALSTEKRHNFLFAINL